MKTLIFLLGFTAALFLWSGCAINIHNSQNTQGETTANSASKKSAASGSSEAKATAKSDVHASGTSKTSVKVRQHTEGKTRIKIKLSKKTSEGVSTADKYKKGRLKLKAGGKLKGTSVAKGKVKVSTTARADGKAKGRVNISLKDKGKKSGKRTVDKSQRKNKKEPADTDTVATESTEEQTTDKVEPEEIEYQEPPDEPSDNEFGYEEPIYGCFEGEVMFIEPNSSKLPTDYSKYEVASVLYACEWDIPARSFDSGFPGVENQFEWFAIRYSGSFAIEKAGTYTFRINSDDGAKLFIDGNLVVDNDGTHPPQSKSGSIELSAGDHEMVLEYFQGPRYYIALQLFVTPPNGEEGIFSVR